MFLTIRGVKGVPITRIHSYGDVYLPYTTNDALLKDKNLVCIKGTERGQWNQNTDLIINRAGGRVVCHEDHHDLVIKNCDPMPTYTVSKVFESAEDGELCNMSKKGNGCVKERVWERGDPRYGGHLTIKPLSVYSMFGHGSVGGLTHAIHNSIKGDDIWDKRRFGAFTTSHYTIVHRPNF